MAKDNAVAQKAAWAKAAGKAKSTWKSARKAKGGQGFEEPEIEDGTYRARLVKASFGVSKKSHAPYTNLRFLIVEPDSPFKGNKHGRLDMLMDEDEERQQKNQENFSKTMHGLGYELEELDIEKDIPDLVEDLNKSRPYVELYIKNWQSDKNHGLNIYVNRTLTEDEVEELGLSDEEAGDDSDDGGDDESSEGKGKKSPPGRGAAPKKKAAPKKGAGSRR